MKKSLIFVGMLSIGFAYAQEGNVGINTDKPNATLDIQPNADNAKAESKTNQGIIAPRLSKTRIANIETPVEGTLVYVTDETSSPISTYTGTNTKVAKITEKGYYFYNGTEWVKAGSNTISQIWQKQSDNTILLIDADIKSNIKYYPTGAYTNIPKTLRQYTRLENPSGNTFVTENFNPESTNAINSQNLNIAYADETKETYQDGFYKDKQLTTNYFFIDDKSTTSPVDRYFTQRNSLEITSKSTRNYTSLYSAVNSTQYFGKGRVNFALMGAYNLATLYDGSAARVVGSYNQATTYVPTDLSYMDGTYSFLTPRGTGKINEAYATRNHLLLNNLSSNTMKTVALTRNHIEVLENATGTIDNLSGMNTYFQIPNSYTGIKNQTGIDISSVVSGQESNYGLRIADVGNNTAQNNYAIYSNAGKIRFGNLAQSGAGDRVVYADENGVLKAGVVAAANVKLATANNVECTSANTGTMNFGSVTINGQATEAFGFCMKNSAGEYKWYYIYGGAGITTGSGAFGSGL